MSGIVTKIRTPLSDEAVRRLRAGMSVTLSGVIYTARDAAHQRMVEALGRGEELPFDLRGQIIYYVGPTPAPPGKVIGSAGPTTSSRMDAFTIPLLERGLKGMIGKGGRSPEVVQAIAAHTAVYFAALGGAGALISQRVKKATVIAYEDLDTEAIRRLVVEDLPLVVAIDCDGNDIFRKASLKAR